MSVAGRKTEDRLRIRPELEKVDFFMTRGVVEDGKKVGAN